MKLPTVEVGSKWSKPSFPVPTIASVTAVDPERGVKLQGRTGRPSWWPWDRFWATWKKAGPADQPAGRPKRYVIELHRGYWRLRREGNHHGTARASDKATLRELAKRREWVIRETEEP